MDSRHSPGPELVEEAGHHRPAHALSLKHREQVDVEMSGINRDHLIATVARSPARLSDGWRPMSCSDSTGVPDSSAVRFGASFTLLAGFSCSHCSPLNLELACTEPAAANA
jgi:hypothetical protein